MDIFDEKIANNYDIRKKVYDEMFKRAEETLNKEDGVILDATFVTQELRRRAAKIAAAQNKTFVILQTNCSKKASINRILKRTKEKYESNALTEQAYINNLKKFEKVDLKDLKKLFPKLEIVHLTVDTELDNSKDWYIIGMEKK
jgi:predicted kinase